MMFTWMFSVDCVPSHVLSRAGTTGSALGLDAPGHALLFRGFVVYMSFVRYMHIMRMFGIAERMRRNPKRKYVAAVLSLFRVRRQSGERGKSKVRRESQSAARHDGGRCSVESGWGVRARAGGFRRISGYPTVARMSRWERNSNSTRGPWTGGHAAAGTRPNRNPLVSSERIRGAGTPKCQKVKNE